MTNENILVKFSLWQKNMDRRLKKKLKKQCMSLNRANFTLEKAERKLKAKSKLSQLVFRKLEKKAPKSLRRSKFLFKP